MTDVRRATPRSTRRLLGPALAGALAAGLCAPAAVATPAASNRGPAPAAYDLPTDGIRLEGIGVDRRSGAIYVSATNQDGTIYRALPGTDQLRVWVGAQAGANGRGIAVDDAGRVFVAGGPSGAVRVFDRAGALLAHLPTGVAGAFLNDLWVGPDGSVYVTDSTLPTIWRVRTDAAAGGSWRIEAWLDVSATIPYTPLTTDFDLGGITTTPGGHQLILAQGTTGQLWRVELSTGAVSKLVVTDATGARVALRNADGIALRGDTLYVVQNFLRQISTVELTHGGSKGTLVAVTPTSPTRTFTTAKLAGGRLLAVDSTFGLPLAPAADRVVAFDLPLGRAG
jgi:Cu-Zn family superoxide dismutase